MYHDWNFILSTTGSLEGYHVVKQCGVVYGETVFKHSFLDNLSASIHNKIDSFSLRGKELSGSVDLIEIAREHAYRKMIEDAKKKDANAIIGIKADTTMADKIMYLSLYGTAVKVISNAEYDRYIETEKKKQELRQKEKAEMEEKRAQHLKKIQENNDMTQELLFLKELPNKDTVRSINILWEDYGLNTIYPEIDNTIKDKMSIEKLYGLAPKTTRDLIDFLNATLVNTDDSTTESKHFDVPLSTFDGICPVCGTKYYTPRNNCFKCGATFASE